MLPSIMDVKERINDIFSKVKGFFLNVSLKKNGKVDWRIILYSVFAICVVLGLVYVILLNNGIDIFKGKNNQPDTSNVITERTYYVRYLGDADKISRLGAKYSDYIDFEYYAEEEGGAYNELPTFDLLLLKSDSSKFSVLTQTQELPLLKVTFKSLTYISQGDGGKLAIISDISDLVPVACIYDRCADSTKVLDETECSCSSQDSSLKRTYVYKGDGGSLGNNYSNFVYFVSNTSSDTNIYLLSKSDTSKFAILTQDNIGKSMFFNFSVQQTLASVNKVKYIQVENVSNLSVVNTQLVVYKGDAAVLSTDYNGYSYFQYTTGGITVNLLVSQDSLSGTPVLNKSYLLTYTSTTFIGVTSTLRYERLSGVFEYVQR